MRYTKSGGFTLIELMITIAIVGILAAIAIPSYQNYARRAWYSEVVQAASPYTLGVAECFQNTGVLSACGTQNTNGIPPTFSGGTGKVASVTVGANGKITVVPNANNPYGIGAGDTYELTPSVAAGSNSVVWTAGGGGVTAGYASATP